MVSLLNQQLADTFDLYSQVKQAHWNVKGPQFIALHELFDRLAEELQAHVDLIAERATALGGKALGTVRMSAANSRLPECDLDVTDSLPTVEAVADRYATLTASTRRGIENAENHGDAATADLLTEVCAVWTRRCGSWRHTCKRRISRKLINKGRFVWKTPDETEVPLLKLLHTLAEVVCRRHGDG